MQPSDNVGCPIIDCLLYVASGDFALGRDVLCEFDYWPLAVSMPPTKVCPQCKAAVPVRWKTCERS